MKWLVNAMLKVCGGLCWPAAKVDDWSRAKPTPLRNGLRRFVMGLFIVPIVFTGILVLTLESMGVPLLPKEFSKNA